MTEIFFATMNKDKIMKMKNRLKEEGNETVTKCHRLKMIAKDGKNRMTDVVDIEGMFRLIESNPLKKAEPIKLWLARFGKKRMYA